MQPVTPYSLSGELRRLAELAWPVVIGQLGMVTLGVVDVLMLGRVSEDALAAVGIANTWSFGTLVFGLGTATGIDPVVTQAFGAGDARAAGRALVRGGVLLLLLCAPIVALHLLAGPILLALGQPASLVPDAASYCRIMALSVPAFLGFALVRQFLQGSGAMRPAMYVLLVGNVANVFLNYALIFGYGGIPALGVAGAAWATVGVRWAMLILLVFIGRSLLKPAFPVERSALAPAAVGRLAFLALPAGLHVALEVWAFSSATVFAGHLGPTPLASHTVALNITSVLFMVPLGIGAAAATRVGNLVGAGQDWITAARAALLATFGVMCTWATLLLVLGTPVVRLYTSAEEVVMLAAALLPIAAAFQLFDGAQIVSFGLLRGLGDTRRPALYNLVGHWMLGIPLGWVLAFQVQLGLRGLWLGLSVGLGAVATLLLLRLRRHTRHGVSAVHGAA